VLCLFFITFQAHAEIIVSPFGNIGSSISLKADGKNATLHFTQENKMTNGSSDVGINAGFQQTLFPDLPSDGRIHLAAISSSER